MTHQKEVHIPYLSQDEQIFLNTTATFSQYRRMSNQSLVDTSSHHRPSLESNHHSHNKRHQVVSVSSLSSFLFKRRGSSTSSLASSTSSSMDFSSTCPSTLAEDEYYPPQSPKARELESLIFEQPQRTVRLSLTPRCAV
ncbi:hypothetical protein V8B55DRAFT_1440666 [Mucor lusitanicus]|uniref:Uncharacterized protein n=2 Tax=Mucor circinelloides f. lusitanicus TaxID=29924 RepID=A0A168NRD2_MUCCL|nr:hypothetical protein FB192DRAFT_1390662 [Mucor lusitanicus]OAD06628.1 hypothetical protein MUCCIDRAFT_107204 [Mucor lusitanicus CBS 277.49]